MWPYNAWSCGVKPRSWELGAHMVRRTIWGESLGVLLVPVCRLTGILFKKAGFAAHLEDERLCEKCDETYLGVGQEHMGGVAAVINHALK
jgi:hypothetical protein